ncbi:unnamed protein product [Adineta ricciae]|uniref:Methyltransferase FkbM domain-containing protein n=1 Tax=Adineta ricciae TaxID=249248 RepID=A0A814R4T8_ADIRI|nr:unnamed protein product [Adineta ricciae]CAF1128862.1 unnamed protein product [Adineta ricciae]
MRIASNRSYTCETRQNISNAQIMNYRTCLTSQGNWNFWSVESLRHTAHKHLFNSSSLIIEVGGNRGHDTVEFIKLHNPWIMSYEPLPFMAKNLSNMFKSNPKVQIFPYGLGNHARNVSIEPNDYGNAGTSLYRPLSSKNSSNIVQVEILEIVEVIENIRRTKSKNGMIDMISINCEGCEFEIIPALIINNLTQFFRVIQFGSHIGLVPSGLCIYCQIEEGLERTHTTLFHYNKVWEGWVLKNKTTV